MNEVQPIRNPKQIDGMCKLLKERDEKYYIMFKIGINTGLRVSDILKLKVSEIDSMYEKKITEKKTSKRRFLYLNSKVYGEIQSYIKNHGLKQDDYLIYSRKHGEDSTRPIGRVQAYRVLNEIGAECGIDSIGTHTMRKTFGYHYYKKTKNIAILMRIFNHSSQSITLDYIGISDDEIRETMEDFNL